jgi:hypothetical protein
MTKFYLRLRLDFNKTGAKTDLTYWNNAVKNWAYQIKIIDKKTKKRAVDRTLNFNVNPIGGKVFLTSLDHNWDSPTPRPWEEYQVIWTIKHGNRIVKPEIEGQFFSSKFKDGTDWTIHQIKESEAQAVPKDQDPVTKVKLPSNVLPLLVAESPQNNLNKADSLSHTNKKFIREGYDPAVDNWSKSECEQKFKALFDSCKSLLHPEYKSMETVFDALTARFLINKDYTSNSFTHPTLDQVMAKDPNFMDYRNRVLIGVVKQLKTKVNWKLSAFEKEKHLFKSRDQDKPNVNVSELPNMAFHDKLKNTANGLLMCIDAVARTEVYLTEYKPPNAQGICKMKLKFKVIDTFGLDDEDIIKYGERYGWAEVLRNPVQVGLSKLAKGGFSAWWLLQHKFGCVPFKVLVQYETKLLSIDVNKNDYPDPYKFSMSSEDPEVWENDIHYSKFKHYQEY